MVDQSEDEAEALLFSLAYCSRASRRLSNADIETIVNAARLRNSQLAITGWLVYGSGIFFQWLEGGREEVKRLMESITADLRHNTIVVLSESEDLRERLFGEWDMELVSTDHIREVLVDAISESDDAKNIAALRVLVKEVDLMGLSPALNKQIDL